MIITIDGPAGTGKSTVAKEVADRLGFVYFDTGAMYRSITLFFLDHGVDLHNKEGLLTLLEEFRFSIQQEGKKKKYFVQGRDITEEIRSLRVTEHVSYVSAIKEIRKKMVSLQREYARGANVVFEGRDMGTVVFPKADIKFFLTATPDVRAKRRLDELRIKFPNGDFHFEHIFKEIEKRDYLDSTRSISPLKQAEDAHLIDTSDIPIERVVEKLLSFKKDAEKKKRTTLYPKMAFFYKTVLFFTKVVFKLFYRYEVYGREHYIPGSALIAANHLSFYDPPLVAISCPDEIHFLARASLFQVPFLGWLIRHLNSHPVADSGGDTAIFKSMIALLQQGKKVLVFPEGTRSLEKGEDRDLKAGVGFLLMRAGSAVIPTYIEGTYEIWGRDRKFPKLFGKTICVFGSPIYAHEFLGLPKRDAMQEATKKVAEAISALQAWVKEGKRGSPP